MSRPKSEDPFAKLVLHHELFDWSDPSHTPDSISRKLMGPCGYWNDPRYVREDAKGNRYRMRPIDVEREILFEAKRPNWSGKSRHGKSYYQHMLVLGKLLFPDGDISPALADEVMFFCMCVGEGRRKILNLIGSQNAGKSYGCAFIAFIVMFVDPERTMIFVANPYDKSSESQDWGTVVELWNQLLEHWPNGKDGKDAGTSLYPNAKLYADRYLDLVPGLPKAGRIELRGVKNEGKFRGTKATGKEVDRGVIMLIVGEVNLIENHAFIDMTDNLKSQPAFIAMTSQNFKDEQDQGGRLTEPSGAYEGDPASFETLDPEADLWWHSARASVTLRLDGYRSPNILKFQDQIFQNGKVHAPALRKLIGKDIYPKLFSLENLSDQLEAGEHSPSYFSQVRSFPIRGDEFTTVLSTAKVNASRHTDTYFTFHTRGTERIGFCDPAFGGRDSGVVGFAEFGTASVTDGDGQVRTEDIIHFPSFFRKLKLVKGAWYPGDDDYWKKRMDAAGISTAEYFDHAELSYEIQIAIQCKEFCLENRVPFSNFGYDFSMRHDIVAAMHQIIGPTVVGFDYNQGPEGVFLQNIKKDSKDACHDRITELAFLAADFFLTRQVRGGSLIPTAIQQLTRTQYTTVGKKLRAEKKIDYKARWTHSPDHRDVLMGIAGMAAKRGFRAAVVGGHGPARTKSVWAELNARGIGSKPIIKRI